MTDAILVLNAGSSSLKFAVFGSAQLDVLCRGGIDSIGEAPQLTVHGPMASLFPSLDAEAKQATHETLTDWLLGAVRRKLSALSLVAVGHRIVHGGRRFDKPVHVDADVLAHLDALVELAPGHEAHSLASIRAVTRSWPSLPQIACFDTQFHRTQPRLAQIFALPRTLTDGGILRYGFHGLSYEYIANVLPKVAGTHGEGKVVVAHLGNGSSMCAMIRRQSIATTMSYTPLDGLMMGTRCGSIDAGVVLHLMQHKGMSATAIAELLGNKSGLLGVSGISGDVRELEASSHQHAVEALELFAYRATQELGSLVAVLGGLDVLVFTGGIGEHSADIRRRICEQASWAGVDLDSIANADNGPRISTLNSKVSVFVIPTNEELVVARAAMRHGAQAI
jgi:acetate kinase